MDIPESKEVKRFRLLELHRDNVMAYWLFLPAIAAMLVIIVMVITQSGVRLLPYMVIGLLVCYFIAAFYRRGWKGIAIVIGLLVVTGGLSAGFIYMMNRLLSSL